MLILLDLKMPTAGGLGVLQQIKADPPPGRFAR
jgi:CheY-like chemotaxis protein